MTWFRWLQESIKDFERNLFDMVASFIEYVQGQFTQCRDFETQHHEKLLELSIMNLEKVVKNEMEEEMPEDLRDVSGAVEDGYNVYHPLT